MARHQTWILCFSVTLMSLAFACGDDDVGRDSGPPDAPNCTSNAQCDDGLFCNGRETCSSGACVAGAVPCEDGCEEATDRCMECDDVDGDGFAAAECGGLDCDDADSNVYPGATEVCDLIDQDCDPSTIGNRDADGDGVVSSACCNGDRCGGDCDDSTLARRPGQLEICDDVDNDCDGSVDEEMNDVPWYEDADGDGFGSETVVGVSCTPIPGASLVDTDCDDTTPSNSRVGVERCDAVDNDCDGTVDEGCPVTMDGGVGPDGGALDGGMFLDGGPDAGLDSDDGGIVMDSGESGDAGVSACPLPVSERATLEFFREGGDRVGVGFSFPSDCVTTCDPAGGCPFSMSLTVGRAANDPNAAPVLFWDEAVLLSATPSLWRSATSRELRYDTDVTLTFHRPFFPGDYVTMVLRWDRRTARVSIRSFAVTSCASRLADEATSGCNGIDDDCDGNIDEGLSSTTYPDVDGDGVGSGSAASQTCGAIPADRAFVTGDCDDFDATRSPRHTEVCNGIDDDCDGNTDENPAANVSCNAAEATASCVSGACVVSACTADRADCDGDPTNGCEVDTRTSAAHCGGCGVRCVGTCAAGSCSLSPLVELAAGRAHRCVLNDGGRVACSGDNSRGQLGDGTTTNATSWVGGVQGAISVVASNDDTCAALASGRVSCWGGSFWRVPEEIAGLSNVEQVAMGSAGYFARRADGTVVRFTTWSHSYEEVPGVTDAIDVTASSHACIARAIGSVVCFGENFAGQVGDGTTDRRDTPRTVMGLSAVVDVEAGNSHTCARRTDGSVACWGYGEQGQLGDGRSTSSTTAPVVRTVSGLTNVTDLALGYSVSCAIASGRVWCWGQDAEGVERGSPVDLAYVGPSATHLALDIGFGGTLLHRIRTDDSVTWTPIRFERRTGLPCAGSCADGARCMAEGTFDNLAAGVVGSTVVAADTVAGLPGGGSGVPGTIFRGGYCQPTCFNDAQCGLGAVCLGATDSTAGSCYAECDYDRVDNGGCRDGYVCLRATPTATTGVCYSPLSRLGESPGTCDGISDTICKVERCDETDGAAGDCVDNGIAGIQTPGTCAATPASCGGDPNNYDRLWYNPTNPSVCNRATYFCEHPGDPTSSVGDSCVEDWDCPTPEGLCLDLNVSGSPRSYCTSLECDTGGAYACDAGFVCNARAYGANACLEPCTTGAGPGVTTNPATWRTNDGGCDVGFACYWDGRSAATEGACIPGNFNAVTSPNTGATCDEDSDCWSPFGRGRCLSFGNGVRFCSVIDCTTPLAVFGGYPPTNAGCGDPGAICVGVGDGTACFESCTTGDDCAVGLDCAPILSDGGRLCFRGCETASDCHSGQTCVGASAAMLGTCT